MSNDNVVPLNPFRDLWALGYHRLVPITPPNCTVSEKSSFARRLKAGDDARGKAPGVRWSDGSWSGFDWLHHETDETDLDRWARMGAGVGIRTGDGLVLIDADTENEDRAKIILQKVHEHFGDLPVRIGKYPKAGYLVRTDNDFQYTRIEFGERNENGSLQERVEILAEGRQFVAHGVHPKTGKPYRWPKPLQPLNALPYVQSDALVAFLNDLRPLLPAASDVVREGAQTDINQAALKADIELVKRAVSLIPNTSDHFPTREAYRMMGYAIKGATQDSPEAGFEMFAEWCERWQDGTNDPDVVAGDWGRMKPPFRVGAAFLFDLAEKHGNGQFSRAEQWFDATVAASASYEPLFPPESLPKGFLEGEGGNGGRRFIFTPLMEAAESALTSSTAPLVKGLLDQGAMTVLYGESNSGKTFVTMDLCYHIASGREWGGMRVTRMPVLYVAAEGGQGAKKRAAALAAKYGAVEGFYFLLHPVNLLRVDADLKPLIDGVRAFDVRFGLIVIDTLSRAMAGGDENASTDMGAMVKHLDVLRKATGAHVLTVHHSGKDKAKGARGHSLLRAATDTEIEIADNEISVTKQRDLDKAFASGFALDVVTLGIDNDGDPITSCTVRLVKEQAIVVEKTTDKENLVLDAIKIFHDDMGDTRDFSAAQIAQIMADFADKMSANAVRTYLGRLVKKGLLKKGAQQAYNLSGATSATKGRCDAFE
ncbi:AAA family ATPase [Ochrobactrum sp. A-1]|uniref:AAA family ATPase n=1 Tax=Ochrobactrum sp. A-1 TaxID=2920940 RepID=UPI001F0B64A1|nr:AAA family ATPase [Ochrobactrum sp. A-1]